MQKLVCVGNCVHSFDDDGDCINDRLPWSTVSHFAVADEQATIIDKEAFLDKADPTGAEDEVNNPAAFFLAADGVMMVYNPNTDIHYFFA